jgi:hypothetical protein
VWLRWLRPVGGEPATLFARRIAIALARRKELGEAMAVARTCGLAEPVG